MPFSNQEIDIDLLPFVNKESFIPLEMGYGRVIFYENIIFAIVLLGGLMAFYFNVENWEDWGYTPYILLLVTILLIAFLFWFRPKAFAQKSYLIREHDVLFQSGLWWTNETAVPFARIQHSAISQGPIARAFGYATLKLFTAGGNHSDLSIPALNLNTAEQLKSFIGQKTHTNED